MAEILLKSIGPNKVRVIKVYREVTGLGLKEAKEAVDAVECGEMITITGINSEDVSTIIECFTNEGATVVENIVSNVSGKIVSKILDEDSVEVGITMTDIDNIDRTDRKAVLSVLADVLKVSENIDALEIKVREVESKIKKIEREAEDILEQMSPKGKKVWFVLTMIITIFFLFGVGLIGAIVMGAMGGFLFWIVVKGLDDIIYVGQKEENKQKYLEEHLYPQLDIQKHLNESVEAYLVSEEVQWAVDTVGNGYFNTQVVQKLYDLISERRADSLKEAINLYETIKHQENMQDMQNSILKLTETNTALAKEQAEYARQTEKNTRSAARTAKVNAVINYGTYKNAKNINKKLQ